MYKICVRESPPFLLINFFICSMICKDTKKNWTNFCFNCLFLSANSKDIICTLWTNNISSKLRDIFHEMQSLFRSVSYCHKENLAAVCRSGLPSEKTPMWAMRSCSKVWAFLSSRLCLLSLDRRVHTLMAKSTSLGSPDNRAFSSLLKLLCLTMSVDIPTTLLPWAVNNER